MDAVITAGIMAGDVVMDTDMVTGMDMDIMVAATAGKMLFFALNRFRGSGKGRPVIRTCCRCCRDEVLLLLSIYPGTGPAGKKLRYSSGLCLYFYR
jgi:hypothetical protein